MSTEIDERSGKIQPGPVPDHLRLENLMSAEKIREVLHRTFQLSDENFEDIVNDIGARAALLVLRAKAVSGDVKALDLYFKVVAESKARRASKATRALPSPENASFVRRSRRSSSASPALDESASTNDTNGDVL